MAELASQVPQQLSRSRLLLTFLAYFLPLQVGLCLFLGYFYFSEVNFHWTLLAKGQSARMEVEKNYISADFTEVIRDLLFLADSQTLKLYLDQGTSAHREAVVRDFALFCHLQQIFDQVRYVDNAGMEVIRINFAGGQTRVVPPNQLQSKAQRYYFLNSIKLKKGEVYVSPFDLNIEGRKVERPFKPMIRFATPVFDSRGQKRGVIILNYLGQDLINLIQELWASTDGQLMLLNDQGYWLYGPKSADQWGFMFPAKQEVTFGQVYPEAWRTIKATDQGQLLTADGLFTFATIYPLWEGLTTSSRTRKAKGPNLEEAGGKDYRWKIVSFLPVSFWQQTSANFLRQIILLGLLLFIILTVVSWLLARSRLARLQAEAFVQRERDKLRDILDAMPVGICVITQDQTIVYINPLLEKVFGPVAGRNCHDYFLEPGEKCIWTPDQLSGEGRLMRQEWFSGKTDRTYDLLLTPLQDNTSRSTSLLIFHDITELRRSEAALRELSIMQQAILDGANYTIISTTPDGIITTFNAAAERWLGYAASEVVGQVTPALIHDAEEIKRRSQELAQELGFPVEPGFEAFVAKASLGGPDEREWTYIRKDGTRFPVLLSVTALRHEDGEITGFLGIGSDITERKRAQETVSRLAAIVEFTEDAIIGKTLDGIIFSWNQGAERIYGYTAAEVVGKHVAFQIPPEFRQEWPGFYQKLSRGERIQNHETVRLSKDGRRIDVSMTISPIRDAEGIITGISTIARDITERKQVESQLRKLSLAVEQSPASVVITDTQGSIEYVNPKFTQITGYRAAEALGQNPRILKSGDKSPEEYRELWETITSGREWRGFFHNRKKNGDLYWESASISPIKDAQGRITHFVAVKEDITTMKEVQEQLATLSLVASKTDNTVVIADQSGAIEWVNDGFTRLTGYTLEEVVGKKPGSFLQGPDSDREAIKKISTLIQAREPVTAEILNYHKNGQSYWVSMDITPIFDEKGELTKFISIERDITQRKETEAALHQAKEAADAANRAKSEFLASMSHEIRTPMNAIIGMADLLWETSLTQEQQQYVEVFRAAGETLLDLINDILDLSKVEAGQITLENIDLDLAESVEKVCEVMAFKAHQKELELACHIRPQVPTNLIGDPMRLRQILTNLVGNAIKFTEAGEVLVEIDLAADDRCPADLAAPCHISFVIKDTGIGISPEKLELIFDKFTQADNSTTRKYGGTGLGLAISKHLVKLMGGELEVQSQVGQGSTFRFTIPFTRLPEPGARTAVPIADLLGLRVLIVDDNATNRLILRELMTGWGAQIGEAANGLEGLTELKRAQAEGQSYQLVLLDGRMPQMDGFGMAEAIHDDEGFTGTTVMMLTSDARSGDLSRAHNLGIASYLVKPVKRHDLREAIDLALHQAQQATAQAPLSPEDHQPLRILLADDSADNRLLIRAYLKKYPFELDMVENGKEALSKFQAGSYDLVLMDMQMPVMDGYEATRRIREWERQRKVSPTPVIALTAYALKEEINKSMEAGCTLHLNKPIKKNVLLEAIAQYGQHSRGE